MITVAINGQTCFEEAKFPLLFGTEEDLTASKTNPPTGDTLIQAFDYSFNNGNPYVAYGGVTNDGNMEQQQAAFIVRYSIVNLAFDFYKKVHSRYTAA